MNHDNLPKFNEKNFTCPHCGIVAMQDWKNLESIKEKIGEFLMSIYLNYRKEVQAYIAESIEQFCERAIGLLNNVQIEIIPNYLSFSKCQNCSNVAIWLPSEAEIKMIYPRMLSSPPPNEDMNDEVKKIYIEAANIYQDSPRASAALLRLCVEKLCEQLGETGSLNDQIKSLVKKGLQKPLQEALDSCRIIGNNAIHAGKITLEEDPHMVKKMFHLINHIANAMITEPKEHEKIYSSIPDGSKKQIEKRDKTS